MMKSQPERLHDRLQGLPSPSDGELEALVARARQIQAAPQLRVEADFARRLERRLLAQSNALQGSSARTPRWLAWSPRPGRTSSWASAALLCTLIVLLGGTGVLTAVQGARPDSPLYALKRWENGVTYSFENPALAQIKLDEQLVRDQLNLLTSQADPAQAAAYRKTLQNVSQSLTTFTHEVDALPAGTSKDQSLQELTTLKTDARRILHSLLPHLALQERGMTSSMLATLGENVPRLTAVDTAFAQRGKGQMTVTLTLHGENLQSGARLIVDNQVLTTEGSFQGGNYIFVLDWTSRQPPRNLGLLNPDGTVALSTTFAWKNTDDVGDGNSDKNPSGKNNPPNNGENEHGDGKPGSTATPPGHDKPGETATPPGHH